MTGAGGATLSRGARAEGISSGGRYVLFAANVANLEDPAGDHAETAISTQYVRDTVAGTTTAISRASGASGELADESSEASTVSADGRYVAFATEAGNLPGANGVSQAYLRDLQDATTTLVSQNALGAGGDRRSNFPILVGGEGCEVQFSSLAFNLLLPETTPVSGEQLYIADLCASPATQALVSEQASFLNGSWGASADGERSVFGGAFGAGGFGLFVADRASGETAQIDRASGANGALANDEPQQAAISENGCRVVFGDRATNLYGEGPPEGPGGERPFEIYVRQLAPCRTAPAPAPDPPALPGLGGAPAPSTPAVPTRLRLLGLSGHELTLYLSGAGRVSVRVRRFSAEPRRHWKFVETLVASAAGAERVSLPLTGLAAGRYRLNLHLHGSGRAHIVRFLKFG
ncbi:MAG: hypothetical protein ACOYD4_10345 [Solirubrobacterales bacterium]